MSDIRNFVKGFKKAADNIEKAAGFKTLYHCDNALYCYDIDDVKSYVEFCRLREKMLLVIQYVWDEGEPAHEVKLYNADNELVDAYIRSDLNSAEKIADTIMEIWSDYIYKGNKEEN